MVLNFVGPHLGQPQANLKSAGSNSGLKATMYTYFLKGRGIIVSDFVEKEVELWHGIKQDLGSKECYNIDSKLENIYVRLPRKLWWILLAQYYRESLTSLESKLIIRTTCISEKKRLSLSRWVKNKTKQNKFFT